MGSDTLSALVRDLWLPTMAEGLFLRQPVLNRLFKSRRITWKGGQNIARTVDTVMGLKGIGGNYSTTEPFTFQRNGTEIKPYAPWKKGYVPLEYDVDDMLATGGGTDTNPTGVNFVKHLVKKGQEEAKLVMSKNMYAAGATGCDTAEEFYSINDALTHDVTYMYKSRADTTTNKEWQGASIGQTYADQATARGATIGTVRDAISAIRMNSSSLDDLLCVVGTSNFNMLRSQVESQQTFKQGPMAKYGLASMYIDDVEVVEDPFLENAAFNTNYDASKKYLYVLNIPTWELRLHPQRSFTVTPFVHQATLPGGTDCWRALVLWAGNLVCWEPAHNILLTNVWSGA